MSRTRKPSAPTTDLPGYPDAPVRFVETARGTFLDVAAIVGPGARRVPFRRLAEAIAADPTIRAALPEGASLPTTGPDVERAFWESESVALGPIDPTPENARTLREEGNRIDRIALRLFPSLSLSRGKRAVSDLYAAATDGGEIRATYVGGRRFDAARDVPGADRETFAAYREARREEYGTASLRRTLPAIDPDAIASALAARRGEGEEGETA